ncbi:hypothetical protein [Pseudoalteromonas tunicata]|jgi:hypothetical protein|uniref:Uncharacterized protein n=1 Tax=Pseudoalteromonas tunicata D2 TaxID=87626 RepID=A4C513_9GAMM|nr:hypothetical protein [Pseudoalteromonas tunicata]ATC96882.1 hypothetical protein PTUN_b0504 [Pseudoalteromonas tunicata]AXT33016.1 hypothetical protein D1819_19495 [Pseudoalteromonas tunicata]EAR30645.1 hypothetical protein PTD2_03711 [Pseudoalteromonas tunicata D2]
MKSLIKISFPFFVLSLFGCSGGGGSDKPDVPEPLKTFTLNVEINGATDAVNLNWLGSGHKITASTSLSRKALNYSEPTGLSFPLHHHCQSQHTKQDDLNYLLKVNCDVETQWQLTIKGENLISAVKFEWFEQQFELQNTLELSHWALAYQAPSNFNFADNHGCELLSSNTEANYTVNVRCQSNDTVLLVPESLPYAVSVSVNGLVANYQEMGSFSFNEALTLSSFNIEQVVGPAECAISQTDNTQQFSLLCKEFTVIEEQGAVALVYQDSSSRQVVNGEGKTPLSVVVEHLGQLRYLSSEGIELLNTDNGIVTDSQLELAKALAFDYQPSLNLIPQALLPQGLYGFENDQWALKQPLTDNVLPFLHRSDLVLSFVTLDEAKRFHVFKRVNGNPAGSFTLSTEADKSTGLGIIFSDDISIMTFWDDAGRLGYQLALQTSAPLVDYIEAPKSVSVWQKTPNEHRLVRVHNGHFESFESYDIRKFAWIDKGATKARNLVGLKDRVWLGDFQENQLLTVENILNKDQTLLASLQAKSGKDTQFKARFNFASSPSIEELLPKESELGWVLLWQADEQNSELGTIWLSDGIQLNEVKSGLTQSQFLTYQLTYTADSFIVVTAENERWIFNQ